MKKHLKTPLAIVAAAPALSSIAARTMKTAIFALWLSALALPASAADAQQPAQSAPKPPRAKITAVATDADKRTLLVRYEIAGTASEERITFAQEVADFRYCPWYGDYGIAVVARTGAGKAAEYFYSTFPLPSDSQNHKSAKIPAPPGDYPVLGIGSTHGDSVVITAAQHSRNPADSISSWLYIDNCPATESGLALGHVTAFTVPAERPQLK